MAFLNQFMSKMFAFPEKLFCGIYFYKNLFNNYSQRHFKTCLRFGGGFVWLFFSPKK